MSRWFAFPSVRTVLKVTTALLLGILCFFALIIGFIVLKFGGDARFPADCAIVFGTAVRPTYGSNGAIIAGAPGPGIVRRVSTAVELYRAGKIRRLFLTGGTGEGMAQSEAEVMRQFAIMQGVDARAIVTETGSHSTWQNLLYTRPLTGDCHSIIGVSDRYHLARIEVLAHAMQWNLQTYPAAEHADRAFESLSVIREAFGIILESVNSYSR